MNPILTPGITCLIGHVIDVTGLMILVFGVKYLSEMRNTLAAMRKHQIEENPKGA